MEIKKAVIPIAGYGTRLFPASKAIRKSLFPIVDRQGVAKPVVQVIIEEAISAGIERVCLIINPKDEQLLKDYFFSSVSNELSKKITDKKAKKQTEQLQKLATKIDYVIQPKQEGYGSAVYCAKDWVGNDSFLLLLGDHVYISDKNRSCIQQVISAYNRLPEKNKNLIGVCQLPEDAVNKYGIIAGEPHPKIKRLYYIHKVHEKPTISYAKKHLRIKGIPKGKYLCFSGIYILSAELFSHLEYLIKHKIKVKGEIQLTTALEYLLKAEIKRGNPFYGYEIAGSFFDIGTPVDYVKTLVFYSGLINFIR